uniref:HAT C-terminal dimerisation domain-containing protein n=1 Tax=Latimeria chalumnae TaxID=7897 RepID=H3AMG0_LATCH
REYPNRVHWFSKNLFHGTKANGEKFDRKWILYSPTAGNVYCFCCKLLSHSSSKFATDGFSDWRNTKLIKMHESCDEHQAATFAWLKRSTAEGCIDSELQRQCETERKYWFVEVVKFLSERGLAFRGDDELIGSPRNGNFLGTLELLAKFDPFLADHISRFGNRGQRVPSYLSSTVCDELIDVMGAEVLSAVCKEVHIAKYFSISVDSTPDTSRTDQLTLVSGKPVERFLKLIPIRSHSDILKDLCIDIENCRGQSYNNAANISGQYMGLQARIKEMNPLAVYVPCAAHSVNLVGTATSVNCCLAAANLFGTVQQIYTFAAESAKRWNTLTEGLSANENGWVLTLKTLSSTRWHCHADSIKALSLNYGNFFCALKSLAVDEHEPADTRLTARTLAAAILQQFHKCSVLLQSTEVDLTAATAMFLSLEDFVTQLRDQFDDIENIAKNKMPTVSQMYTTENAQVRRPQRHADDSLTPHVVLTGADRFRTYKQISIDFAFLQAIAENDSAKLQTDAAHLINKYSKDFDADSVDEFVHFLDFISHAERQMPKYMKQNHLVGSTFPNVAVALCILLTLPVTVCEGEHWFSKMSLIKNSPRSTMIQDRLNALAILSIE